MSSLMLPLQGRLGFLCFLVFSPQNIESSAFLFEPSQMIYSFPMTSESDHITLMSFAGLHDSFPSINQLVLDISLTASRQNPRNHAWLPFWMCCVFFDFRLRYLRNRDRSLHQENYPALYYPEMYLLEGGYKEFCHWHLDLCEPRDYKPMVHKDHSNELAYYRSKSRLYTSKESQAPDATATNNERMEKHKFTSLRC